MAQQSKDRPSPEQAAKAEAGDKETARVAMMREFTDIVRGHRKMEAKNFMELVATVNRQ